MQDNEIARSLGRLEGKVDLLLERFDSVDQRVHSVEKKVWYGSGIAAMVAFLAPYVRLH